MNEQVGIELRLMGYDGIYSNVDRLEKTLNRINRTRYKVEFGHEMNDLSRQINSARTGLIQTNNKLKEARQRLADARREAKYAREAMKGLGKGASDAARAAARIDLDKATASVRECEDEVSDLIHTQNRYKSTITETTQQMRILRTEQRDASLELQAWDRHFNRVQAKVAQIGAQMQTLGKTMSTISATMLRPLALGAFGIMSKTGGALERYDTMKTYSRIMSAMGYDSKLADKSIEKLNESVLGLPTGLDEIIEKQKMYTVAANDMAKGTEMAIAANNAVVAGGLDAVAQRRMELQLKRLLTTGEMTAKQWNSLLDAAPLAFNAAVEEMGMTVSEFMEDADAEKFLEAFIKVGTSGKVAKATEEMKHTFSSVGANIENAFRRNIANVVEDLDKILIRFTGKDVIDTLLDFKAAIDDIGSSVREWIAANPEKIVGFLEKLRGINFKGYAAGAVQGVIGVLDKLLDFLNFVDDKIGLEKAGRMAVTLGVFGKGIAILGGIVKGAGGAVTGIVKFFHNLGRIKIGGKLFGFFKGLFKNRAAIEGAGTTLSGMATSWQGVASKAATFGGIALVAVALKPAAEALSELASIENVDRLGEKVLLLGGLLGALGALATALGVATGPAGFVAAAGTIAVGGTIYVIAHGIKEVAEAVSAIADVELPTPTKIRTLMSNLGTILTSLGDVSVTISDVENTTNLSQVTKNVERISESFAAIDKLAIDFGGLDKKIEAITEAAASAYERIKSDGGFWEAWKAKMEAWRTTSLSTIVGTIADMGETIKKLSNQRLIYQDTLKAYATIRNVGYFIGSLNDTLEEAFDSLIENHYVNNKQSYASYFTEAAGDVTSVFTAIDEFGLAIRNAYDNLKVSNISKWKEALIPKLRAVKRAMDSIFTAIRGMFESNETYWDASGGIHTDTGFQSNIDAGTAYIEGFNGSIENLKGIISSITTFADQLKAAADKLNGVKIKDYVNTINKKIQAFRELDFTSLDQMSEAKAIEITIKATVKASVRTKGAIAHIVEKIGELKDAMQSDASTMIETIIHVTFKPDIPQSTMDYVVEQVRAAIGMVRTRISALYAWITKDVYVQLIAHINGTQGVVDKVNTAVSSARRQVVSTGGYISKSFSRPQYRASGGTIFKRKGTDIVPAMLTPGEYVLRNRAVSKIGLPFLQRLNNLDIAGAIRSLSLRQMGSYTPSVANRITNNNNNAKVTQNFYGAGGSPRYAFQIANRYVGAL